MKNTILLMAATFLSSAVSAQDFNFGNTTFKGSGCKAGTTSTIKSPDGKALSILFDDFAVEVPQFDGDNDNGEVNDLNPRAMRRNNENVDHKRCAMIINADVPEEEVIESISIQLDMRGSAYIEEGARVVFQSVLRNWKGRSKRFKGHKRGKLLVREAWNENNFEEEWLVSKTITIPVKTGCHARSRNKVSFSLNNALIAKINPRRGGEGSAFSTIDSHDLGGELKVSVKTKPCGSRINRGGGRGRVRGDRNRRNTDHGTARANRGNGRSNNGGGGSTRRHRRDGR